jgi:hypothetical protein
LTKRPRAIDCGAGVFKRRFSFDSEWQSWQPAVGSPALVLNDNLEWEICDAPRWPGLTIYVLALT